MLHELVVENYAVVERIRVRFHPGFNLLTGETGSGKSIVVGALGLLLGRRASADVIRVGADRARVSGIFESPVLPQSFGIEGEDGELIIEREILAKQWCGDCRETGMGAQRGEKGLRKVSWRQWPERAIGNRENG